VCLLDPKLGIASLGPLHPLPKICDALATRPGATVSALLALCLGSALAQPSAPGEVRVEGSEASGDGLIWKPALTDGRPAYDRELAWDAAADLQTQHGAWYQRLWGLKLLRHPTPLDDAVLEDDRATVEQYFRDRGWTEATVTVVRRPGPREGVEDVRFETSLGPRTDTEHPVALYTPEPQPGWTVSPVFSALSRGAFLSGYVGVHGDWMEDAPQPRQLELHAEGGIRAFADPDTPAFGSDIGPWSDLRVQIDEPIAPHVALFGALGGSVNLWPGMGEGRPETRVGLMWGRFKRIQGSIALRGGHWRSWAWNGQEETYDPWFEGTRLAPGQVQFFEGYSYTALHLDWVADGTDRKILPRRGARLAVTGTPLGWARTTPFFRGEVDLRTFVPLGSQRWVWGTRARFGGLSFRDDSGKGLLGERFFLGAMDMRAWGQRRIMPPSYPGAAGDLRPGGNWMTYGNTDLAWHLHRDLALIAFTDIGRVWETFDEIAVDDMLVDVGMSMEIALFLSSLRLDLAYRPTLQPSDSAVPVGIQLWMNMPW
jgi:hypothetical protein